MSLRAESRIVSLKNLNQTSRVDLQHANHLTEHEDTVTVLLETGEKLVEEDHLSRIHNEAFERFLASAGASLGALEEEGVVGRLLELHRDVQKGDAGVGTTERLVVLRVVNEKISLGDKGKEAREN